VIIQTKQALKFRYADGSLAVELKVGVDNHVDPAQLTPQARIKLARLRAANIVFGYEDAEPRFNRVNPRGRETLEDVEAGQ